MKKVDTPDLPKHFKFPYEVKRWGPPWTGLFSEKDRCPYCDRPGNCHVYEHNDTGKLIRACSPFCAKAFYWPYYCRKRLSRKGVMT